MKTHPLVVQCPTCKARCDCATETPGNDGRAPQPGDYTTCLRCGEFLRITEAMGVVVADLATAQIEESERQLIANFQRFVRQNHRVQS